MKRRVLKILMLLFVATILFGCGATAEDARKQMEKQLYEDYGEEFVVNYVGIRSANGEKFYQGKIHPKSIEGTPKEKDKYYYSTASIEIKSFGRLGKYVADSYGTIKMNDEAEKYLLPKAKELFGERIRLKTNIKYKELRGENAWVEFLEAGFEKKREEVKKDPEHKRLEVELDIYVFDKIDNEEEKEERRKEIFEYIQYLKEEELFEYLEMGVIFIDERVLAPSYAEYRRKIDSTEKEKEVIDGEELILPPKELRKEMIEVFNKELNKMSEEEKTKSMNNIIKSDFEIENKYLNYFEQYYFSILSIYYLKDIDKYGRYKEVKENGTLNKHYYKKINDIENPCWFIEYISNTLEKEKNEYVKYKR